MWLGWSSEGKELWPLDREPVVSPPLARGQTKSSLQLDGVVGEGVTQGKFGGGKMGQDSETGPFG